MIELLLGGGLVGAGVLLGRLLPNRKKTGSQPTIENPRCCEHSFGKHDPKTGVCNAETRRNKYDSLGEDVGYEYVPCPCRSYDGPRPLEAYYANEITE